MHQDQQPPSRGTPPQGHFSRFEEGLCHQRFGPRRRQELKHLHSARARLPFRVKHGHQAVLCVVMRRHKHLRRFLRCHSQPTLPTSRMLQTASVQNLDVTIRQTCHKTLVSCPLESWPADPWPGLGQLCKRLQQCGASTWRFGFSDTSDTLWVCICLAGQIIPVMLKRTLHHLGFHPPALGLTEELHAITLSKVGVLRAAVWCHSPDQQIFGDQNTIHALGRGRLPRHQELTTRREMPEANGLP
mmetsp:Transcript_17852/g.39389  ORF Transcript_17852/g.39389 Transcript_17852/m.39389 type:complete len:244 (-) Transcript_17852:70-801(-)